MICDFSRDDDNVGGNTFVPSNTLLEPNNVIPSWEFGDEEKKEVSGTLRKVREKYDNIHKAVLAKDKELEMLKVRKTLSAHWLPIFAEKTWTNQGWRELHRGYQHEKDKWTTNHWRRSWEYQWDSWLRVDAPENLQAYDRANAQGSDSNPDQGPRTLRELQIEASHRWGRSQQKQKSKAIKAAGLAQARRAHETHWLGSFPKAEENRLTLEVDQEQRRSID